RHYEYNPSGAVSQDTDIDPGRSIIGIAFSRGTLYGYDYFSDHLVSINTLTGGVTDVNVFRSGGVNQVADSRRFFGLYADSSGALMASVQQNGNSSDNFWRLAASGDSTLLGQVGNNPNVFNLSVIPPS